MSRLVTLEGGWLDVFELALTGDQDSIFVDAMKSGHLMETFGAPSSFTSRRVTPVVSPFALGRNDDTLVTF